MIPLGLYDRFLGLGFASGLGFWGRWQLRVAVGGGLGGN